MHPRYRQRGFTLIELLVVVMLVSILAMLAIPAMIRANDDRLQFEDAQTMAEMFRRTRAQAVGRGAAHMIAITANGASDRGKVIIYEAVQANPGGVAGSDTPISTCKYPTNWNSASSYRQVNAFDMNRMAEQTAGVQSKLYWYRAATADNPTALYYCFSASGRVYVATSADFNAEQPSVYPVVIEITRNVGGVQTGRTRNITIAPSGNALVQTK